MMFTFARDGRPSAGRYVLIFPNGSRVDVPRGELWDVVTEHLPPGWRDGGGMDEGDGSVLAGIPDTAAAISPNALYVARPSEIAQRDVWGASLHTENRDAVLQRWARGERLAPVSAYLSDGGRLYIEDGNHRIQAAAQTDRPVVMRIRAAARYQPRPDDDRISARLLEQLDSRPGLTPNPGRGAYVTNPPWVAEVIAASYETLEDTIPPAWLPRLVELGVQGKRLGAEVIEYGCGVYGCVIPTVDPKVVLKLTTDATEAEFAADFADNLAAPVCVKYRMVIKTRARYEGSRVYLLWRDSAQHVGQMATVLGAEAVAYVRRQWKAGQMAFDAARKHPSTVARFVGAWLKVCASMASQTKFPDLQPLGAGLIKVWQDQHIIFGDIHEGNLGVVDGRWVITDPGNIAVVDGVDLAIDLSGATPTVGDAAELILKAERTGRPSQKLFVVSGIHVPITGEVIPHEQVREMLYDAMPPGFEPGPYFSDWLDFAVVRGLPLHNHGNTVYITTPSDLAKSDIYGRDLYALNTDSVSKAWEDDEAVPAISVEVTSDGRIYVVDGNEALQLAAYNNRLVAVVVKEIDPGWQPPADVKNISRRLLEALPSSVRAKTLMSSHR
jgi:hypothetical protein